MQAFVATVALVSRFTIFVIFANAFEVANSNRFDAPFDALCDDMSGDGVQVVRPTVKTLP